MDIFIYLWFTLDNVYIKYKESAIINRKITIDMNKRTVNVLLTLLVKIKKDLKS